MEVILFYIFGGMAVVAVTLMIFQSNPVASAIFLVFALFCISALYVLLEAPFVAILQVLLYAGAIMVLFVFVLMLLRLKKEDLVEDHPPVWLGFTLLLGIFSVVGMFVWIQKTPVVPFGSAPQFFGEAEGIGRLMFSSYLIPFEMTSILLLVAIVGVVVLGKRE